MAKLSLSGKRLQISQANSTMVIFLAIASFVTIFSLVASKALLSKRAYQGRVLSQKSKTEKQLQTNLKAADSLVASYKAFTSTSTNAIGGSTTGQGDRDGDNAKIVLDALPSKYDFPALISSLEKILSNQKFKLDTLTGSDDEITQSATAPSATPQPVTMPFQVSVSGNYTSVQDMVAILEHSIRPIQIQTLSLSGDDTAMKVNVSAITFYQPEKTLTVTTKVVK